MILRMPFNKYRNSNSERKFTGVSYKKSKLMALFIVDIVLMVNIFIGCIPLLSYHGF